ncbi:MAG: MoaD/ThiS family protein [Terriglobales bacterium]
MQVTVKLFATFRHGRFATATQDCPPGTRVADVIRELQIPAGQVGMILLNNRHVEPEQCLEDGASLALFPFVGGG